MKAHDAVIVLELATKLNTLVKARQVMSENVMLTISIEFENPQTHINFHKDQVIKFDVIEDLFLALMDSRITAIQDTIQKVISIVP